jgi:PAS domain S-box-containing protein
MKPTPTSERLGVSDGQLLVSKTDTKGRITYANRALIALTQYKEEELLGEPHNIIRHPDMPRVVYKHLWSELQSGREVHAFVKNIAKTGAYYWVFANITPSYDPSGALVGYHSARHKPNESALIEIEGLYSKLRNAEKSGGMNASEQLLTSLLKEKGVSYEEYVLSL